MRLERMAKCVEVTILILPIPGIALTVLILKKGDVANAALFGGTLVAILLATLVALLSIRTTQHDLAVQVFRSFLSPAVLEALKALGPVYANERLKKRCGAWTLQDNLGYRYVLAMRNDAALHSNRRELSGAYETMCSLVAEGTISRKLAVSLIANLDERAAMMSVVEEFLALSITIERYPASSLQQMLADWNTSRRQVSDSKQKKFDIEVGKPNMRALSRMFLTLSVNGPTTIDYDGRGCIVKVSDLLVATPEGVIKIKDPEGV